MLSAGAPVFRVPALARDAAEAAARLRAGDAAGAARLAEAMLDLAPDAPLGHAFQALALARLGQGDAARAALREAAARGFPVSEADLRDPIFAPLRGALPEPAPLAAPSAAPAAVTEGVALVSEANTLWRAELGALRPLFAFPGPNRRGPPPVAATDESPEARLLTRLHARGLAAGNRGDLYDNRDAGHSRLPPKAFPQLAHVAYAPEAQAEGLHYGLNQAILFDAPTIGNSSTAVTSGRWRSLPRLALTTPGGATLMRRLYAANHLYVFPSNRDHETGRGDLYPANTPYVLISQGRSGSDRPLLRAAAMILAAFRPDTKAALRERGLIAPIIQMILRRGLNGVASDEDYLSPRAHPTVFAAGDLNVERMVRRAAALTPKAVPPAARIAAIGEPAPEAGIALFGEGLDERLFDTPEAVARAARGTAAERRYTLEAAAADPDGRPVSFVWRVLRGDSDTVTLQPLDPEGRRAELTIRWSGAPPTAPDRPDLANSRVDVAVFARLGAEFSAPAFFSLAFSPCRTERRAADGLLLEIDYAEPPGCYADPAVWAARNWRDRFDHDATGRLVGWTRERGKQRDAYTRHGHRIVERDALDRPIRAERVRYPLAPDAKGRAQVAESPTGRFVRYVYDGPNDRFGVAADE